MRYRLLGLVIIVGLLAGLGLIGDRKGWFGPKTIHKVIRDSSILNSQIIQVSRVGSTVTVSTDEQTIFKYTESGIPTEDGNYWHDSGPHIAISPSGHKALYCQSEGMVVRDMQTGKTDLLIFQNSPQFGKISQTSPSWAPDIHGVYGIARPHFITDDMVVVEFMLYEGGYSGLIQLDSNQLIGLDGNVVAGSDDGSIIAIADTNVHWIPELSHWISTKRYEKKHLVGSRDDKLRRTTAGLSISQDGNWIAESEFDETGHHTLAISHRFWDSPQRHRFPPITSMRFWGGYLWSFTESNGITTLLKF
ncbi:hypothetical protein EBR57_02005, partial [bacterium]|nr:hypothetical protein [bacterium]